MTERRHQGIHPDLPFKVREQDPKNWGFRIGVFVRRNPVVTATVIALLISAIPIYLVVRSQQDAQKNRIATSLAVCEALNIIGTSVNGQNVYLQGLLIQGAESTRIFDDQLRKLGFPPLEKRLQQAQDQANGLSDLAVPSFRCGAFAQYVQSNASPKDGITLPVPTGDPKFPPIPTPEKNP